ncbi:MAG: hypothetical protein LBT86_09910 [Deltaproteobacteria bacterium]|jgi:predicted helicase|nr:hypothetical protein [Deltaproteobacteria bacterium]
MSVNGRSAIEWILDRYQVKVDKASDLNNDPNDWAKEPKKTVTYWSFRYKSSR